MDTLLQDLRYAARTLRRSPGFTAIAVLCLALGIGVNTTIFSVVDAALLEPFPFREPHRLVALEEAQPKNDILHAGPSYKTFLDLQEHNRSFSDVAAFNWRSAILSDGEEPERLLGGTVSWNLFPMLGIQPVVGRGFREEDDRPGAEPVVLVSYDLWQRHWAGDRSVIGRSIILNAKPATVIGVMPPRFNFPESQDIWVPIGPIGALEARNVRGTQIFARLKPGVSLEQARSDGAAIGRRLAEQYPLDYQGWETRVRTLRDALVPQETALVILTMMGAVSFVLLIACANVANLMLARATARHREIAIRAALGAGKGRIVRQLLTESVIIAIIAGAIGIPLAKYGLHLLDSAMPREDQIPYYIDWDINGTALLYTVAISVLTGIIFGLAPALQAVKSNLQEALREGARGGGASVKRNRLRSSLVVAEVALSLILLVGASLFVRSFMSLQKTSAGFDTAPLMTMRFYMPGDQYESATAKQRRADDILARVEAIPGVEAAAVSPTIPIDGGGDNGTVLVEGRVFASGEEPMIGYTGVTAHWLRTLHIPLLKGRDFTDAEARDSSRVTVINETLAKRLWPDADPVGRRFRFSDDTVGHWFTVLGVAPDIKDNGVEERKPQPMAYLPYVYLATRNSGLIVRTTVRNPVQITAAVRQQIRLSDPLLPVFDVQTMEKVRELDFWQYGLFGWMFSIFGVIALLLAAVGVYGVLAYAVQQRRQEIGVRMALGAGRADVLRLVVGHGVTLAGIGIAIGLVGAFGVSRIILSLLYVSATDPVSFAGVAVFLIGIAALASYLPARKAMGVDPIVALRNE